MNYSFGRIAPVIQYDIVTHSSGLGGPFGDALEDLRNAAKSRVATANANVYSPNPSTPSIMKHAPRSDLEAHFVAAFWLATGAVQSAQTGKAALARLATEQYEKGESYWDSWSSWLTWGFRTGADDTDNIQVILSNAATNALRYGAIKAQNELKKLILAETNDPAVEPTLPAKITTRFADRVADFFIPKSLQRLAWLIPVGIGVIALAIILPKVLKRRRAR